MCTVLIKSILHILYVQYFLAGPLHLSGAIKKRNTVSNMKEEASCKTQTQGNLFYFPTDTGRWLNLFIHFLDVNLKKKSFWGLHSFCFSNPDLNKYLFCDYGDFLGHNQNIDMGLLDTSLCHSYLTGLSLGEKIKLTLLLKHFLWKLKLSM